MIDEIACRPPRLSIPRLADQRIRFAEIFVELINRRPRRVARAVYYILAFDRRGVADVGAHGQYCMALLDISLNKNSSPRHSTVTDAKSRFVAAGGKWKPSRDLEYEIYEAALGNRVVPVLSRRDAKAIAPT